MVAFYHSKPCLHCAMVSPFRAKSNQRPHSVTFFYPSFQIWKKCFKGLYNTTLKNPSLNLLKHCWWKKVNIHSDRKHMFSNNHEMVSWLQWDATHLPSSTSVYFQVVMSYLSFLCARLLDLRNETRAARVIQGAWRKCRLRKDLQLYKVGSVFGTTARTL